MMSVKWSSSEGKQNSDFRLFIEKIKNRPLVFYCAAIEFTNLSKLARDTLNENFIDDVDEVISLVDWIEELNDVEKLRIERKLYFPISQLGDTEYDCQDGRVELVSDLYRALANN